ncbi:MAG: hypothetical protein CL947_01905 [Epsilonproteobacteria bacterium]|nr:hypothetical protein [Campylobacterota bacterium]
MAVAMREHTGRTSSRSYVPRVMDRRDEKIAQAKAIQEKREYFDSIIQTYPEVCQDCRVAAPKCCTAVAIAVGSISLFLVMKASFEARMAELDRLEFVHPPKKVHQDCALMNCVSGCMLCVGGVCVNCIQMKDEVANFCVYKNAISKVSKIE